MVPTDPLRPTLASLGLTEKEASLYLAALELKRSQIVPIAERVDIPRTTAQYLLEKLAHQGLISIGEHRGHRTYQPTAPERVLSLLQNQQSDIAAQVTSFQTALPELMQRYKTSPFQPRVQIFQGRQIRELYEQLLDETKDEYFYTMETDTIEQVLGKRYLNDWIKRRIAKGIWSNGIRVKELEANDTLHAASPQNLRRLRFAPKGYRFPAMVLLYGDNVATITSAKENFAVVVTSHDYALTMRVWFEALWEKSAA